MSDPADTPREITCASEGKAIEPVVRSRFNLVLCIVLAVNVVLQFIALVTPGWNTRVAANGSAIYESVYYRTLCVEGESGSECETETFRKIFLDRYDMASDARKRALVLEHNLLVRYQMNIQLIWFILFGVLAFQFARYFLTKRLHPTLNAISALGLTVACSWMYQVLYEAFSRIDYQRRALALPGQSVGFPYCVFFYFISFVQICVCTFLIAKQTLDYIHYLQLISAQNQAKYDDLKKRYDSDVEGTSRSQNQRPNSTGSNIDRSNIDSRFSYDDRVSYRQPSNYGTMKTARDDENFPQRQSPSSSPRTTRYDQNRAKSRYMELLERAHASYGKPTASLQDYSENDIDQNQSDYSTRTFDRTPRHGQSPIFGNYV